MEELITFTDGGARGNPGPAAIGVVIKDVSGKTVKSFGEYVGETTNNQAEYRALVAALENAKELGAKRVRCFLDSELVVKQMKREYKVKEKSLQPLFLQAWNLAAGFSKISFTHIPREKNYEADAEVNKALDNHVGS